MLATLFVSVADAVIAYTLDKLDPAERIKSWLKRDPVTLAFQKSLARAYSAFARQYPDYANSLFDETFLTGKAVPELSKLLIRNQHPDPALLAQAWGESLVPSAEFSRAAIKPASDFLLWLEAELKGEQALQPLFDSRALDTIEAGIEKLTQEIQRGLDNALKSANGYQIQIGGNVTNSNIIVGDNNTVNQYFYLGDFASLSDYYILPDGVFQRVRVDEFVGRDWLTAKVDAFLNDLNRKSGAFLLVGDAGVGKTAFMAHLVKERRYLHLFAEQAPGQAMLQRALQSLGSQLVTRYQIDPYKDRDTLTQLAAFPDFLERLLRLAASTLTNGEKIVIVCDALDEAGTFPDGNVFGLPNVLPDGVYLILSQRPVNVKLPNFELVTEKLDTQGEGNLQDMQAYLSAVAKRPEVAGQIRSKEYSEDFFAQTLKEKSQGVWMYLYYIIKEIESGVRAPLDLTNLPTGLVGYYAEYWDSWRTGKRGKGEETWDELYAPLLTTLAAAQEVITVDTLIQWADVTAKPREVTRLLAESWRAFITEKEVEGEKAYTPYHLSLKDFIAGRVDTDKLPPTQANLIQDLATQTVDAHKRIVKAFETECNCECEKLADQDYPRLHLTAHLDGAKEYKKLTNLLTDGDEKIKWAEARAIKEETYAGYLGDLAYIWEYAERERNNALAIRCMLIENSIHSLASNIPPELLAELPRTGKWGYARCLSIIRQKSNPFDQASSLEMIAPNLPKILIQEAFIVACEIPWNSARARALAAVIPYIKDEQKTQALIEILEIADGLKPKHNVFVDTITDDWAKILVTIAPHINEELMPRVFSSVLKIRESDYASAFESLAPFLREDLKIQALTAARKIRDSYDRSIALAALVPFIEEDLRINVLKDAALALENINDGSKSILALVALTPHIIKLVQSGKLQGVLLEDLQDELEDDLQNAVRFAREIQDEVSRVRMLVTLAPQFEDEQKINILQDAISVTFAIKDDSSRARALATLMPHLNEEQGAQTLSRVREIKDEHHRARELSIIARYLNAEQKTAVLQEALIAVFKISDKTQRAIGLAKLVPYLSEKQKTSAIQEAFYAVDDVEDKFYRSRALSALIPQLNEDLKAIVLSAAYETKDPSIRSYLLISIASYFNKKNKTRIIQDAFSIACEIEHEYSRARALVSIAPHLNEDLIENAISVARGIQFSSSRSEALAALAPHIAKIALKTKILEEALATGLETEISSANCIVSIAPLLNEEQIKRVLTDVQRIRYDLHSVESIAAIAPYIHGETKTIAIQSALSVAQKINREHDRAKALVALIPHISNELKPMVIAEAFSTAQKIDEDSFRIDVLTHLAPYLGKETQIAILCEALFKMDIVVFISLNEIFDLWKRMDYEGLEDNIIPYIRFISKQERNEGLEVTEGITPILIHFSGPKIAEELYRAIRDTARWWP